MRQRGEIRRYCPPRCFPGGTRPDWFDRPREGSTQMLTQGGEAVGSLEGVRARHVGHPQPEPEQSLRRDSWCNKPCLGCIGIEEGHLWRAEPNRTSSAHTALDLPLPGLLQTPEVSSLEYQRLTQDIQQPTESFILGRVLILRGGSLQTSWPAGAFGSIRSVDILRGTRETLHHRRCIGSGPRNRLGHRGQPGTVPDHPRERGPILSTGISLRGPGHRDPMAQSYGLRSYHHPRWVLNGRTLHV